MSGLIFRSNVSRSAGLAACFLLTAFFMLASIQLGLKHYSLSAVLHAYTDFQQTSEQLIIKEARVPRALIAASVGASLAVAGALMQALTRNPLASPSLFGINSGAALCIVIGVSLFNASSLTQFTLIAFIGAGLTAIVVFALGSLGREGLTPIKMTLAGASVSAFAASITQGLLLVDGKTFQQVLYWLVGSVAGRELSMLEPVIPYMAAAWIVAMVLARPINILMMGEDLARGLGQKTGLVKAVAGLVVVFLAGGAVAVAGPIGFIGIVIPHIARFLVGNDHRWVIPYSALLGAILLLAADVAARYIIMPQELPVGVVTAFIGVPFFVYIARRRSHE